MRTWSEWMAAALAALMVGGCSSSHEGGDGDGGSGEACGPVTCDEGEVCCNASCGICIEPGGGCPDIACVDSGPPPACGDTTCTAGEQCCPGCSGETFCASAAGPCPAVACPPPPPDGGTGTACGARLGDTCGEDEYCDFPSDGCDFADGTGRCRPRPEGCDDDCPQVCGCDGKTYCNTCYAAVHRTDVQHEGPCETPAGCEPMDAWEMGACEPFRGYKWDGDDCVIVSGCECVGTDCDSLYESEEACIADREACIDDCRVNGCPEGESCEACAGPSGEVEHVCVPEGSAC